MNKKLAASLICSTVFGGGVTWLARSARSPQRDFRALCDVAMRLAADPESTSE